MPAELPGDIRLAKQAGKIRRHAHGMDRECLHAACSGTVKSLLRRTLSSVTSVDSRKWPSPHISQTHVQHWRCVKMSKDEHSRAQLHGSIMCASRDFTRHTDMLGLFQRDCDVTPGTQVQRRTEAAGGDRHRTGEERSTGVPMGQGQI